MPNKPDQTNILSIRYQITQKQGDPLSIRGQLPALTIQFEDPLGSGLIREKVVGFNELKTYYDYLKARAESLGKVVLSDPANTFDYLWRMYYEGSPVDNTSHIIQEDGFDILQEDGVSLLLIE